jgi:hemin uptake protein HemP
MMSIQQAQWTPGDKSPQERELPPPDIADVEMLFDGKREIRLIFRGEEYRLRITRNQKLILTK